MFDRKKYRKEYMLKYRAVPENRKRMDQQNANNIRRLRRVNKLRAIALLGGKCQKCGYNKCVDALDFHHNDPTTREVYIGDRLATWAILAKELEKCTLLCSNCHRELHYNERNNKNNGTEILH